MRLTTETGPLLILRGCFRLRLSSRLRLARFFRLWSIRCGVVVRGQDFLKSRYTGHIQAAQKTDCASNSRKDCEPAERPTPLEQGWAFEPNDPAYVSKKRARQSTNYPDAEHQHCGNALHLIG